MLFALFVKFIHRVMHINNTVQYICKLYEVHIAIQHNFSATKIIFAYLHIIRSYSSIIHGVIHINTNIQYICNLYKVHILHRFPKSLKMI